MKIYLSNDVTLMNMDLPEFRAWVFFYLISSVALLWAAFLSAQGLMLWVSVLLVLLVIGTNCVCVLAEIHKYAKKREIMKRLSEIEPPASAIGQK
jgi:Na+-translocating ferredoxin:NAD+ oxidoreductase RnfE subunit